MKKAVLIAALMTLTGCARAPYEVNVSGSAGGASSRIREHTDPSTGCQYLLSAMGGITPRMGPDGKQICQPPEQQE